MPSSDRERRSHVLAVRVPTQTYEAVRRLARTPPQRAAWLREAIDMALRRSAPPQPPSSGGKETPYGVKYGAGSSVKRRIRQESYRELPKSKAAAKDGVLKKLERIRRETDSAA